MSRTGMELRRAIKADIEANPAIDHLELRRKYKVSEAIIDSASTKSVADWDILINDTPPDSPSIPRKGRPSKPSHESIEGDSEEDESSGQGGASGMPGIEQGVIKFTRKPAKMGMDFIFWIPRVYIKNGLVDPSVEYEVYLKKVLKE